jgi:hypothetical protein
MRSVEAGEGVPMRHVAVAELSKIEFGQCSGQLGFKEFQVVRRVFHDSAAVQCVKRLCANSC